MIPSKPMRQACSRRRHVMTQMLVVRDRVAAAGQQFRKSLLSMLKRKLSLIIGLELNQIERHEGRILIAAPVPKSVEL